MKQYEVTFIVDPVLWSDEIKATAKSYSDLLEAAGCTIVHFDEMGLRQLAYPIKKRTSGIYFSIEFQVEHASIINEMELTMRRDERVLRFLTAKLDKYAIKYNDDKRNGKIAKAKRPVRKEEKNDRHNRGGKNRKPRRDARKDAPKKDAPKKEAPAAETAAPAAPVAAPKDGE